LTNLKTLCMTRKKINNDTVGLVMYKSDCKCCKCRKERIQIHHLNGDASNNDIDNLACLCLDCHNDATSTGLTRRIPEATIRKYRDEWYECVEHLRQAKRKIFSEPTSVITTEDILVASKNALIIIELVKIRQNFYAADWEDRADILETIDRYYPHTNFRLAYDLFSFFTEISDYNRGAMTKDVASSIYGLVLNFFPYSDDEADKEKNVELLNECCRIGFNVAFDAAYYLKDYTVVMFGLTILKYVYKKAGTLKIQELLNKVENKYDELNNQLKGSEHSNYKELIAFFRADLTTKSLAFPPISANLMSLIYTEKALN